MKFVAFIFFSALCINSYSNEMGCFEEHTVTAKYVNLERKELYNEISDGRSIKVTKKFVNIQNLLIPITRVFDNFAKYNKTENNPKFFCQEFVSMKEISRFESYVPATTAAPAELLENKYSSKDLRKRLLSSYKKMNFKKLLDQTQIELKRLEETPSYFCMTRHFLESIGRASHFAQFYNEEQKEISDKYIRLQILGLISAGQLDTLGAPLQAEGIAILCQDVPKIPLE